MWRRGVLVDHGTITDRGLRRPGMRADLLLVEGGPTRDILTTRKIVIIRKRGLRVRRDPS